ncbi:hypothetical protein PhAPEC5_51.2 [Escherichia phage vB_EcoP_PhAPEC5]|uniref:Uncharacterized protein n=1 Tax=Escherichia phage vB_EcoP_PhAPEC5 TaxID=1395983 RepID=A0A067Y0D3_9CAUD|nr:hypothetical protein LD33_gp56 [Escherichia phage vB_EcoP_PhAPEC5]AGV99335.1 hypothetical protein PhAPEC5_51.2 [Escherichia phage vB_EcoP_PhAPEC5]
MSSLVRSRKTCGNAQPKFQCSFRCDQQDHTIYIIILTVV